MKNKIETKNRIKYFRPREFKDKMSDLLYNRILHLLSTGEYDIVITTKTKGEAGFIDFENYTIYINPKVFPPEETLVHEVLHLLKPDLDEKTIIEISSLLYEKLNNKRRDKLIAYMKALSVKYIGISPKKIEPSYS